jgi:protein phosphatase
MLDDDIVPPARFQSTAQTGALWPKDPSLLVEVQLAALSDAGKVRPNNEDHYLVAGAERSLRTILTNLETGSIPDQFVETAYGMLVADGMGGAARGEVASEMAIHLIVEMFLRTPDWIMSLEEPVVKEVLDRMDKRFRQVEAAMVAETQINRDLRGMGTTLTLACSLGANMVLAHIGDSRVYLLRDRRIHRLTRTHTVAQELADAGAIAVDAVDSHPMRHVLTRVIGTSGEKVQPQLSHLKIEDGDQVLLCTDGLTDEVSDAEIANILMAAGNPEAACRSLVDQALELGGRDNVTVVLARYRIQSRNRGRDIQAASGSSD